MLEDMMRKDMIPEDVQELMLEQVMLEVAVMEVAMTQMNQELGNLAQYCHLEGNYIHNDICIKQTIY